jgi:hypothetical protein
MSTEGGASGEGSRAKGVVRGVLVVGTLLSIGVAALYALSEAFGLQVSIFGTAVVGAFGWLVRTDLERRRAHELLLNEQKRNQYFQFLEILNKNFGTTAEKDWNTADSSPSLPAGERIDIDEFRLWSLRLTMIGSDEVVRAWNTARLAGMGQNPAEHLATLLRAYGQLLLEMRKDCGHHATKLTPLDMLASVVNEVELLKEALADGGK